MHKKATVCLAGALVWLAGTPVFAQAGQPKPGIWQRLRVVGRFVGYFLLVMAVIYLVLILTRKIGDKWGGH